MDNLRELLAEYEWLKPLLLKTIEFSCRNDVEVELMEGEELEMYCKSEFDKFVAVNSKPTTVSEYINRHKQKGETLQIRKISEMIQLMSKGDLKNDIDISKLPIDQS